MRECHARYIFFKAIDGANQEEKKEVMRQYNEYQKEYAEELIEKLKNGILEMC